MFWLAVNFLRFEGEKKGNLVVTSTKDKRNLLLIDNICYEREGILKEALHIKAIGWRLSFLKKRNVLSKL